MAARELVVIVDDDPAVREALGMLLKASGYRTRLFSSATELLESDMSEEPDCLILDLRMPELDGLELQRRLNQLWATVPVIFLSAHGDISSAVRAMRDGAVTFLQKPVDRDVLLRHLREAVELNRDNRARQEQGKRALEFSEALDTLTPREREVLELVVSGKANKVISSELGISERTVEVHRSRLMSKLGVASVAELVRLHTLHSGRGG